jgi:hypothetical protein
VGSHAILNADQNGPASAGCANPTHYNLHMSPFKTIPIRGGFLRPVAHRWPHFQTIVRANRLEIRERRLGQKGSKTCGRAHKGRSTSSSRIPPHRFQSRAERHQAPVSHLPPASAAIRRLAGSHEAATASYFDFAEHLRLGPQSWHCWQHPHFFHEGCCFFIVLTSSPPCLLSQHCLEPYRALSVLLSIRPPLSYPDP